MKKNKKIKMTLEDYPKYKTTDWHMFIKKEDAIRHQKWINFKHKLWIYFKGTCQLIFFIITRIIVFIIGLFLVGITGVYEELKNPNNYPNIKEEFYSDN